MSYLTDSSASAHSFTANINTSYSLAQKEFGSSSLDTTVCQGCVFTGTSSDWNLGTGDFTIDFWVYKTGYCRSGTWTISGIVSTYGYYSGTGWTISMNDSLTVVFNIGNVAKITSSSILPDQTWTHVAVVRNSGTTTMYFNGVSVGSANLAGVAVDGSANNLYISRYFADYYDNFFNGYIDEVRILKGVAAWTTTFTPPTTKYTAIAGTVLLMHFNNVDTPLGGKPINFYTRSA